MSAELFAGWTIPSGDTIERAISNAEEELTKKGVNHGNEI